MSEQEPTEQEPEEQSEDVEDLEVPDQAAVEVEGARGIDQDKTLWEWPK
jgi:hypothetical protein